LLVAAGIALAVCIGIVVTISSFGRHSPAEPVDYVVLEDAMDARIAIGVSATVDEPRLRATLARAAGEHKYDAARDYLFADYFWIEAYLLDGETRGTVRAGEVRRYVPPRNPAVREHEDWLDRLPDVLGREDVFTISLDEARRDLEQLP
jgi:hypothetical protein